VEDKKQHLLLKKKPSWHLTLNKHQKKHCSFFCMMCN
jgi:hypothetical protein